MNQYIDREEALQFPFANGKYDRENANEDFILGCESYREWLENIPATDAAPVIRCRDCVYWQDEEEGIVEMSICERLATKHTGKYGGYVFAAGPDDFCSFAGRKKEKAHD